MTHYYALPSPDLWPLEGWVSNPEQPNLWEKDGAAALVRQGYEETAGEEETTLLPEWWVDCTHDLPEFAAYRVEPDQPKHKFA